MNGFHWLISITLGAVLATACGQSGPTVPATPPPATKTASAQRGWQEDWNKTLASAKQEGKLVAIASFGGESNTALARAFNEKFGLDIEFVVGRETEINAKLNNERRAGLYLEDVYLAGISSLTPARDAGYLDPLGPLLILPEVLDSKAWLGGSLNFYEKDGFRLSYVAKVSHPLEINTDLVKEDEIKSYKDLLDPKWKGKIVVMDPTSGGAGTFFFMILWEIMGPDFTRELARQDLAVSANARQAAEWLARGKYPVAGSISIAALTEMVDAGAPIKIIIPKEGTFTTASTGGLAYLNKAPHPNAARIFVNWLLTREGQTVMSKIFRSPSRRLDIAYDWLDPAFLPQPGMNYIDSETEEMIRKRQELQKISREVWSVKK